MPVIGSKMCGSPIFGIQLIFVTPQFISAGVEASNFKSVIQLGFQRLRPK